MTIEETCLLVNQVTPASFPHSLSILYCSTHSANRHESSHSSCLRRDNMNLGLAWRKPFGVHMVQWVAREVLEVGICRPYHHFSFRRRCDAELPSLFLLVLVWESFRRLTIDSSRSHSPLRCISLCVSRKIYRLHAVSVARSEIDTLLAQILNGFQTAPQRGLHEWGPAIMVRLICGIEHCRIALIINGSYQGVIRVPTTKVFETLDISKDGTGEIQHRSLLSCTILESQSIYGRDQLQGSAVLLQTRMSLYQLPNHDKKQQNPVCMGSLSSIRPQSESLSNRFFSGFRVLELRILAAPDRYYPPPVGGKNRVHASKDSMGIELEPFYYSIEG
ncbi:hypothetical protein KCU67_g66, partial [Aureobasidium melanogenum]